MTGRKLCLELSPAHVEPGKLAGDLISAVNPADKAARRNTKALCSLSFSRQEDGSVTLKGLSWWPEVQLYSLSPPSWETQLCLSSPMACAALTTLWAFCRFCKHWARVRQIPETPAQSLKGPGPGGPVLSSAWS